MRVLEVALTNVMSHAQTKVTLPKAGVVLVTGANGAGKSSIIEAVSVGVWDVSLRRKPLWASERAEIALLTEVGKETLLIKRARVKAKTSLHFSTLASSAEFETKTKAQEALEQVAGSHSLWRRTHVFSSSDADSFSRSTDGERKRLLEDLLGLDRFDTAHAAVNRDSRDRAKELAQAEQALARLESQHETTTRRVQDLEEAVAGAVQHSADCEVDEELEELESMIARHEAQMRAVSLAERELDVDIRQTRAQIEAKHTRARKAEQIEGDCPSCSQPISGEHLRILRKQAKTAEVHAKDSLAEKAVQISAHRAELNRLTQAVFSLRERRATLTERQRAAAAAASEVARLQKSLAVARRAAQEAQEALAGGGVAVETLRASCANLSAAERVLSLGGVRAHLLGQALGGVEGVANAWLDRLCGGGLTLALSPYSEKASGGVKDAISLEVVGAGNGHGYLAASSGERRRIDIALMLALAEIAEAALGVSAGTMFFDEVFDALDDPGVDAACSVLDEIAKDRCVVVISHNDTIKRRLRVVQRLHVDRGRIEIAS